MIILVQIIGLYICFQSFISRYLFGILSRIYFRYIDFLSYYTVFILPLEAIFSIEIIEVNGRIITITNACISPILFYKFYLFDIIREIDRVNPYRLGDTSSQFPTTLKCSFGIALL